MNQKIWLNLNEFMMVLMVTSHTKCNLSYEFNDDLFSISRLPLDVYLSKPGRIGLEFKALQNEL